MLSSPPPFPQRVTKCRRPLLCPQVTAPPGPQHLCPDSRCPPRPPRPDRWVSASSTDLPNAEPSLRSLPASLGSPELGHPCRSLTLPASSWRAPAGPACRTLPAGGRRGPMQSAASTAAPRAATWTHALSPPVWLPLRRGAVCADLLCPALMSLSKLIDTGRPGETCQQPALTG